MIWRHYNSGKWFKMRNIVVSKQHGLLLSLTRLSGLDYFFWYRVFSRKPIYIECAAFIFLKKYPNPNDA